MLRILDAGCGDGINLIWLEKTCTRLQLTFELTGMDYNTLRLERASANVPKARIVATALDATPFPAGAFDLVLCNHVLEHIQDDVSALKELRRIMVPESLLILGVPNEGCLMAGLRNNILQRSILKTTDHVQRYNKKRLTVSLHQAALQPIAMHTSGFFVPHLRLAQWLGRYQLGRRLTTSLGKIMPGQAAELTVICTPQR